MPPTGLGPVMATHHIYNQHPSNPNPTHEKTKKAILSSIINVDYQTLSQNKFSKFLTEKLKSENRISTKGCFVLSNFNTASEILQKERENKDKTTDDRERRRQRDTHRGVV